ncbi:neutral zinc metallopeptidase [Auraticoccus monumenti]|uniref:Putative neutral zinc metallopeptidase n=1 Tax=Auraticoccus monumenti TaxID=675864 RepID=A0A1G6VB59_9ACTN|nr:neutral zinc metallopeptidase [Auraticoccus monumenti]SDD50822.1 Putative neutral zinc metallopeptidase [Auraticoccus monumenti]
MHQPAPSRTRGWLVVAVVTPVLSLVLVLAVALAVVLSQRGPQASTPPASTEPSSPAAPPPATSASPPSPAGPPRPSPTATSSLGPPTPVGSPGRGAPGPAWPDEPAPEVEADGTGLQDNRLYTVTDVPASRSCREAPLDVPPVPDQELAEHAEAVLDCLVEAVRPDLAALGFELRAPGVSTFDEEVTTPCGTITPEEHPAFYCSADTTVYLNELTDDTAFNYARWERGYWLVLAHELGHHLQQTTGVFGRYAAAWEAADASERHELTRRLELQATCFAGVQLNLLAATLELPPDSPDALRRFARENNDDVTGGRDHGDAASTERWLLDGFHRGWGSFGHCRTWSAPASEVS